MATIYALPTEVPAPEVDYGNYDHELEEKKEKAFIESLRQFSKSRHQGDLVGEIVREPRGDGYAAYMIFCERPFSLFHLPLGDAYSAGHVWERGLKLADVKRQRKFELARKKLWEYKKA